MTKFRTSRVLAAAPLALSLALVLSACGGGSDGAANSAAQDPGAVTDTSGAATDTAGAAVWYRRGRRHRPGRRWSRRHRPRHRWCRQAPVAGAANDTKGGKTDAGAGGAGATGSAADLKGLTRSTRPRRPREREDRCDKGGATDKGVTKDAIKMGTVTMHGIALGNLLATPLVNGIKATMASINDRGGVLGRRMSLVDCDDGPGEVSRSKACIKKLVGQDKVFALLSYSSWASASVHSDLAQYKLPAIGTWAYSQTEWQDPYMFPTHMSMIHEAIAGANWVKNVIKPKTYGLVCLTSPEMQLSCDEVQKVLDASGAKMVKKLDVGYLGDLAVRADPLDARRPTRSTSSTT